MGLTSESVLGTWDWYFVKNVDTKAGNILIEPNGVLSCLKTGPPCGFEWEGLQWTVCDNVLFLKFSVSESAHDGASEVEMAMACKDGDRDTLVLLTAYRGTPQENDATTMAKR